MLYDVLQTLHIIFLLLLVLAMLKIITNLSLMIFKFRYPLPYVPINRRALHAIFTSGVLEGRQQIIDLGCGTGTFIKALRKKIPHARIIGVEKDWQLYILAKLRFLFCAKHNRPQIIYGDMFAHPLAGYDAVVGYWITDMMSPLLKKFQKECAPGTIIVSNTFCLPVSSDFTARTIPYGKTNQFHVYVKK